MSRIQETFKEATDKAYKAGRLVGRLDVIMVMNFIFSIGWFAWYIYEKAIK